MDYKYLILCLCISGPLSQSIVEFPDQPIGVLTGERTVIVCGISGRAGREVEWLRNAADIYNNLDGIQESDYDIEETSTGKTGNVEYFNLVITSAKKTMAGYYTCSVASDDPKVQVFVFDSKEEKEKAGRINEYDQNADPPVLSIQGEDTMPGALVADVETRFTCTVTYGSPTTDIPFTLEVEDEMGNRIANYNDSIIDLITDDAGNTEYVLMAYSSPHTLTYVDDGQNFACVITMGDFSGNATQWITVYHKADNITLDPDDPNNDYYKSETVTVLSSSNPADKQHVYYRSFGTEWKLVNNEEDAEDSFVIGNDWENPTRLTVQITNAFDHDGDGSVTDQVSNKTFLMNINACCRTDDGSHLTYSVLMTSLLALLTTLFLER